MRGQRGTTMIELMVAAAVLLVAVVGLVAVMNAATRATAFGHRRTVAGFVRQDAVDRVMVRSRDAIQGATANTWIVDACYDLNSSRLGNANDALATSFTCPAGTIYRSWVRFAPAATFAGVRAWNAQVYAERVDPGCSEGERYSSVNCVAADLLLTD